MINFNRTDPQPGTPVMDPIIILVHGLAASLYDWEILQPELSKFGYASIALDLPGHGTSEIPQTTENLTVESLFKIFEEWVEKQTACEKVILIGHSLGGYLSLLYANKHPRKVKAIVLISPLYTPNQLPKFLGLNLKFSIPDTKWVSFLPDNLVRFIMDTIGYLIRNSTNATERIVDQTILDYKRAKPEILGLLNNIPDLINMISTLNIPTLIIWGEKDRTLSPRSHFALHQMMHRSVGIQIIGAGHVPHQSHPENVNNIILKFLSDLN